MQTDEEIIAVVSAHKEGKKIERCRAYDGPFNWLPCVENEGYDFHHYYYRVAPEPRKPKEMWLLKSVTENYWMECPEKPTYEIGKVIRVQVLV